MTFKQSKHAKNLWEYEMILKLRGGDQACKISKGSGKCKLGHFSRTCTKWKYINFLTVFWDKFYVFHIPTPHLLTKLTYLGTGYGVVSGKTRYQVMECGEACVYLWSSFLLSWFILHWADSTSRLSVWGTCWAGARRAKLQITKRQDKWTKLFIHVAGNYVE